MEAGQHLRADVLDKRLHLAVHLLHALAHLQNDGDAGDVDAKIAREIEDEFKALQILIRVEPCIPLGARRLEQALALVEAQGLRMNLIHLGHRRDHVSAFGLAFCHSSIAISLRYWDYKSRSRTWIRSHSLSNSATRGS